MDKKTIYKNSTNAVMFIVSISILVYFCISNNNLLTLMEIIPHLNYFWLAIALFSMMLSLFFDSMVLNILISDMTHKIYKKSSSFKLTMVGQFFTSITPFGVGGQPMQIVHLAKQKIQVGSAISILVIKFLVYQSSMVLYSLLAIIFKFGMFSLKIPGFIPLSIIGFLSQCFTVFLFILFYVNKKFTNKIIGGVCFLLSKIKIIKNPDSINQKIQKQLDLFIKSNNYMQRNKVLTIKLYMLTFLQLTALFCIPFFIFKAFHYKGFPCIDMIATQAFVTMISSYTPLPGAAGTTEGSFIVLFKEFFNQDIVSIAMILYRFITYYLNIIISFIVIKTTCKNENIICCNKIN